MVVQVFKEITQPNMENTFLNAVKAKQIKNTDIEDLINLEISQALYAVGSNGCNPTNCC